MRSTVQVRIDDETRREASELFERLGLDIPTAIRMFLKQSIESRGLPFQPRILELDSNGFSLYDADRIEKARKQIDEGRGACHELIEA
ncbi:MAG: type II toxin-antitoxin system RelB/DinJ family antitoxin [Synergistaceae bacterium]|jgi:DNA-damage-inducible protein J|nr:type II toxin-antitoxin system RelB/DinJ family antitoxin [Synergistaceae bacterium]